MPCAKACPPVLFQMTRRLAARKESRAHVIGKRPSAREPERRLCSSGLQIQWRLGQSPANREYELPKRLKASLTPAQAKILRLYLPPGASSIQHLEPRVQ